MGFGLMQAVDEVAIARKKGQPSSLMQKNILSRIARAADDLGAPICWLGSDRLGKDCGGSGGRAGKARGALVAAGHLSILEFTGRPVITIIHIGGEWQRGQFADGTQWDATPCPDAVRAKLAGVDKLTSAMRDYAVSFVMALDPAQGGHFHYTPDATSPLPPRHPRRQSAQPLTPVRATPDAPSAENNRTQSNNNSYPCPDGVDLVDWEGLMANRKAKRAPMTQAAYQQILKKLDGWAAEGWPAGPIVAHAAELGWTTVFPTDDMKGISHGTRKKDTRDGVAKALDRRLAAITGDRTIDATNRVAARLGIEGFGSQAGGPADGVGRIIEMPDACRAIGDGKAGTGSVVDGGN